ncbi:hypothetical protein [Nocardioides sp. W7]|uniref:hypothetical protein n=1 Tax=Nocardioides sp. W7 TaxID=2931390 RepID=UPI001FD2540F|nr:hypothetical protein [Nocardioides sp. W7]
MNATDPEPAFELRNRKAAEPPHPPADPPVEEATSSAQVDEDPPPTADDPLPTAEDPPLTAKPATESTAEPRRTRTGLWALALCGLGVVAVVLAFLSWRSADNDPDRARAALRDAAVIEGTAAVETMNSIDYRDVAAGVEAWQDVSTGVLHDQLVAMTPEDQQLLADQKRVATGRVVQAALTELTDRTATLIVAVEVTVSATEEGAEATVKRNRFAADLVRVSGEWKLENLAQVAVGT